MSLPNASQAQIRAMEREAEKRMQADGIVFEEEAPAPVMQEQEVLEQEEQEYEEEQEVEEDDIEEKSAPIKLQEATEGESNKAYNMRMLRERAEKAEREREELMKYLTSQQSSNKQEKQQEIESEEDYLADLGIDADSLAEGKHLKPLMKELKNLRNELNQYKQQSTKDTTEVKLKSQFPDFDKVCTHENLVRLRDLNPDLADTILSNKDQFKQAKLAYEMVKQLGIYKEDVFVENKKIALKNSSKPRPLTSLSPQQGDSPLSKANSFANGKPSEEMMRQYWKETQDAIKRN